MANQRPLPVKILMVLPEFHPIIGGAEIQAKNLSLALRARGIEVDILTRKSLRELRHQEVVDGLPIMRVDYPRLRFVGGLCLNLGLTWQLLKQYRSVQIVHFHITGTHMVIPFLMAKLLGKKVVVKVAGTTEMTTGFLAPKGAKPYLLRMLLRWTDSIVALSGDIRNQLVRFGFTPEQIVGLPNGVDTHRFISCGQHSGPLTVLFVGRLVRDKGLPVLWEAIRILQERGVNVLFDIVGDGPLADELHESASGLGIANELCFHGSQQNVLPYLQKAGIFVLPSLGEGLPNALLEAMACGLPVVVTRVGGVPDVVQDGVHGFVVEPADPGQLAAAIERLVGDQELRQQMGERGALLIRERYSLDAVAERYIDLYAKLSAGFPSQGNSDSAEGKAEVDRWSTTCFMIDSLERGGAQRQLLLMARVLRNEGAKPFSLTVFREPFTMLEEFRKEGVLVTIVRKRRVVDPLFLFALVRSLRRMRPSNVITFLPTADLWGRLASKLAGVPSICSSIRSMPVSLGWVKDAVLRLLDDLSAFIVCNSNGAANELLGRGGRYREKVVVIRNGITVRRHEGVLPVDRFRIGIVARLVQVKEIETLLMAFALLPSGSEAELVIVGDGPLRDQLEKKADSLNIGERVCFLGELSDPWKVINSFSVGVITSRYEGLSNVIMEFMMAGLPVVATRVGGNPELVVDGVTGYLIEPGDSAGLARYLEKLMRDPGLRQVMGERAKQIITTSFSPEQMVRRWGSLLGRSCDAASA